jgi:hypothetical protein
MLGLIQLGADTCRVSDPEFSGRCAGLLGVGSLVNRRSEKVIGRRREQIRIYVTAEQSELVRMRAHNEGVSISRAVVDAAFGSEGGDAAALRETVALLRDYRRKLEGASTNLRQIARHAHTPEELPENFGDVVEAVDQLTDEINDLLLTVRIN